MSEPIRHVVCTRVAFQDEELMMKYLEVSKEMFIPQIEGQGTENFELVLLMREEHVGILKDIFTMPFTPIFSIPEYFEYVIKKGFNIQTRHDIDDWMSPDYIGAIQKAYEETIISYDRFLIQAQPIRVDFKTGVEEKMAAYTDKRTSMCLSLCQKEIKDHIWIENHGQMWQIANHVVTLPAGYVKWIIHGDNITCRQKNHSDNAANEFIRKHKWDSQR